MAKAKRIALSIELSFTFGRRKVQGFIAYMQKMRDWQIEMRNGTPWVPMTELRRWNGDAMLVELYDDQHLAELLRKNIPIINTVTAELKPFVATVRTDNAAIGRLAAEHLLHKGLEKFAYFGAREVVHSQQRQAAFAAALKRKGFGCDTFYLPGQFSDNRAVNANSYLSALRRLRSPVGIFAANDRIGFGLLEACRQLGRHVPDDVAVVGVDNDQILDQLAFTGLTSIDPAAEKIGWRTAELLDSIFQGQPSPTAPILISPAGIILRGSSDLQALPDYEVATALRFIRNHAHQFIDVTDVMRVVAVPRRSLERRFRKVVGRSIYAEISGAHIERAKKLLAETDWPLAEVARQSGFHSLGRFSAAFSRLVGQQAATYRNRANRIS